MPYATGSGVRIHYTVEGGGPPLVLHPAFGGTAATWYSAGYVEALKEQYTLVLIDPRGHGASDKPHQPQLYTPAQRVADVLAVLDALGIAQAHFLGYSRGGRVGFDLGAQAPERCLSLAIGGADPFGEPPDTVGAQALRQGVETFLTEVVGRAMSLMPADARARWLDNDGEALAAARLVEWPSLEAVLGTMDLPVLIYCGDQDSAYERAQRAAALLPRATFVALPGFSHLDGLYQGAAVLPHITAFLQRVSVSAATPAASS